MLDIIELVLECISGIFSLFERDKENSWGEILAIIIMILLGLGILTYVMFK